MAKNWKEIIDNKKEFADDFVIDIGGDKFKLGDLRTANTESHGAIQRQLDTRKTELDSQETTLKTAQLELANLFQLYAEKTGQNPEDILSGKVISKKAATTVAAAATGLDVNDPLLAPVIQQITELKNTEIAKLNDTVANLQKAVGMALKVNLDDHYERTFGEVTSKLPKEAAKDLTLDRVMKHAADNKIMDRHGRFNLSKAVDELTSDTRRAAEIAEAEERGRKKAAEEMQMQAVTRPGANRVHNVAPTSKNSDGTTKSIEQAIADAGNDPDIWKNALETANAGSVQ